MPKTMSAFPVLTVSRATLVRRATQLVSRWRLQGTRPDFEIEVWENACAIHDEFYGTTGTARAIWATLVCPDCGEPAPDDAA